MSLIGERDALSYSVYQRPGVQRSLPNGILHCHGPSTPIQPVIVTLEIQQQCLVVGAFGRRMKLQLDNHAVLSARIKGRKLQPVCGDHVIAEPIQNEPEWLITSICPRENELTRPDRRGRKEILAANLGCVVVMAAAEPVPDWYIVDRYLAAAEIMNAEGIVVFNKIDLQPGSAKSQSILDDYVKVGYRVLQCSAKDGSNLDTLSTELRGKTAIIVGQSGVGKSSVINQLIAAAEQRTGELSGGTREGKHTTVNSVMLDLPDGGAVIDSPGVRDYAPTIDGATEVNRGFREIFELSEQCRFANCIHLREPDCAIKNAVETELISARRYESYKRLLSTSQKLADRFG
jgi:ribosome biogenesis GTPase